MTDTIFALATAPGRAAVAILRLSGPDAGKAIAALAGDVPPPREARVRALRAPDQPEGATHELDRALVLWFPGPDSYTGEDCAELHLHGGSAVVDAVSESLLRLGVRLAEPGEFTRRAFEHGKLDLSQAEAVADLVDAETEGQRRQALAQLEGALTKRHEAWRAAIVEALAQLEAGVDFPDEELPEDLAARARPILAGLARELEAALAEAGRGERVREGYRIAIMGAPNAGKSSLLNRLAGRDAAIVTALPGTTRDVIELPLVVAGYKVLIADTAGLRDPAEMIEAEGVRRARAWAESADLRLWLVDGAESAGHWRLAADLLRPGDVALINKMDLPAGCDAEPAQAYAKQIGAGSHTLSLTGGSGEAGVRDMVRRRVIAALSGADFPAATRARHRGALEEALGHVRRGLEALEAGPELAAEDVRLAARALGRITGRIDPESVLDRIFSSFCIGK